MEFWVPFATGALVGALLLAGFRIAYIAHADARDEKELRLNDRMKQIAREVVREPNYERDKRVRDLVHALVNYRISTHLIEHHPNPQPPKRQRRTTP